MAFQRGWKTLKEQLKKKKKEEEEQQPQEGEVLEEDKEHKDDYDFSGDEEDEW